MCDIGNHIKCYFCLQVDPLCSVSAGHYIGENVRHHIHKSHPEVAEVFIHIGILIGFFLFPKFFQTNYRGWCQWSVSSAVAMRFWNEE